MNEVLKLPTEKRKPTRINPGRLVLFGLPKSGKTTIVAGLDNCLILELEPRGADFVEAMSLYVPNLETLFKIGDQIVEQKYPYDYLALDTVTQLEEMVLPLAASMYKNTQMGKNWAGGDVRKLPKGSGYLYLRLAFAKVINKISLWAPNIILIGHLKDRLIEKKGEEFSAKELDLSGKLSSLTASNADATGYVYRKDNQTIINFQASEEVICGSRSKHLQGKNIVIAESNEEGELELFWDKIYKQ